MKCLILIREQAFLWSFRMIFEDEKCVQISIPKTGTSSLYALINKIPITDNIMTIVRKGANNGLKHFKDHNYNFHTHGHFTFQQWEQYRAKETKYQHYPIFSFVRNPYDRLVSIFRAHYQSCDLSNFRQFCILFTTDDNYKIQKSSTKKQLDPNFDRYSARKRFNTQSYFLQNKWGEISIDFIGKLESLEEDYNKLKSINPLLPCYNKNYKINTSGDSTQTNYDDYYIDETRELTYEFFKQDFINFGYEK